MKIVKWVAVAILILLLVVAGKLLFFPAQTPGTEALKGVPQPGVGTPGAVAPTLVSEPTQPVGPETEQQICAAVNPIFSVEGAPNKATNVEVTQGNFHNSIGLGSEMILAEPGKELVNPGFDENVVKESGGAIDYWNSGNQEIFEDAAPDEWELPGGGFVMGSFGYADFNVNNVSVSLGGQEAHNWLFLIRGKYGDGRRDTDENQIMRFTKYEAGANLIWRYSGQPNGGFVSENQFFAISNTSHSGSSNCGDAGCTRVSAFFLDTNTGAWVVLTQDCPGSPWRFVASNWR